MNILKQSPKNVEVYNSVSEGLKRIYQTKLLPLESTYHFHEFHSPLLDDADFEAKPMILLVGQYSTGKTTFIKYLLEKDFPGIRIGPEPTTDRFIAVLHGEHDNVIPGNALVVDRKKPFRQLQSFGNAFLSRFQCSQTNSPVLENLTIIDTPGILSGEKQRLDRGYEFTKVLEWFAERVDRILLLFDAHKLDISDEFKRSIEKLKRFDEKIRIVLNKADMVDSQQLMRVYGNALMWSLGKVLNTPEVSRVYIGSFWNEKLHFDDNKSLFEKETNDLLKDIQSLPKNSALRKLNDLIKRARLAKVHALIISSLKREAQSWFFKEGKKREIIKNLGAIYDEIQKTTNISPGDFPDMLEMQKKLETYDFSKFKELKKNLIFNVDKMLSEDISKLMAMIPVEQIEQMTNQVGDVKISMFDRDGNTPFAFGRGEGVDEGSMDSRWVVEKNKERYDAQFNKLGPNEENKITGDSFRAAMVNCKLPNSILAKIWRLSDYDKDGKLNDQEFALAMHLIELKTNGHEIPKELPYHLIPPCFRTNETQSKLSNESQSKISIDTQSGVSDE